MKTLTMYQVRYQTGRGWAETKQVGGKQRLISGPAATRIVRRLKTSGVDAYRASMKVAR
jgi:hypothetical protein